MSTAFKSADILLPKTENMEKWAVVACDQYTSEPEYWADVENITKGAKSAYNLILPEVFLGFCIIFTLEHISLKECFN